MRLSLKAKQVAGVTLIVGLVVIVLSLIHLAWLAGVRLEESLSRGELLAHAIYQQAHEVVLKSAVKRADPATALRTDPGIRSLLDSSIAYSKNVTYAAIVDRDGVVIAHAFPSQEGTVQPPQDALTAVLKRSALDQLRVIYSDRTFEVRQALLLGKEAFGSIRIGVSFLLVQDDLRKALKPAVGTAVLALIVTMLGAMLLSQWLLSPIHVIKSGLSRLGRGEVGVKLDLPPGDEFGELGSSFDSISAELAAIRSRVGDRANLESVVEHLEDAVAIVNPAGQLLFANPAMQESLGGAAADGMLSDLLKPGHPYRTLVEDTFATRRPQGPVSAALARASDEESVPERMLMTHPIVDANQELVGVVLMVRNLAYLGHVQSTLNYSRKLAALGRLLAGVAHEVKNPLNAMTIHLELLKQKLTGPPPLRARRGGMAAPERPAPATAAAPLGLATVPESASVTATVDVGSVMKHVTIISDEIRRLDEVVQGFLKFTRPEELKLQPIQVVTLVDEVLHVIEPEAEKAGVTLRQLCPADLPLINGDPVMLRQALLNLSLNACQAMPRGGTLTMSGRPRGGAGRD